MDQALSRKVPAHPKLRPVEPRWVEYQGQRYLYLHDPMNMARETILVPQPLAPVLAFCDGTRDVSAIRASLMLRAGIDLPASVISDFLARLDRALLLENGAFQAACQDALRAYREAPYRPPSHADLVYPSDPEAFKATFAQYRKTVPPDLEPLPPTADLVGIVSPHIDYHRGHKTYAMLWHRAALALANVELAIVLGTDHHGGLGTLTLTRQSYATPLGVLPTDRRIVEDLAELLGRQQAFAEEMHHIHEHSIELALVWFHYAIEGRPCPVVPILCGSMHQFITGEADPEQDESFTAVLTYLRGVMKQRRTLIIAAGDLAHVGPAFGDARPLDVSARARLTAQDSASIAAICGADAKTFFQLSRQELDSRKYCGLAPIYLALKLAEDAKGESWGYDQCPADAKGGSVVSIVGALLYQDS